MKLLVPLCSDRFAHSICINSLRNAFCATALDPTMAPAPYLKIKIATVTIKLSKIRITDEKEKIVKPGSNPAKMVLIFFYTTKKHFTGIFPRYNT